MKKLYTIVVCMATVIMAHAQSYTGTTKINGLQKLAVINEMPFAAEITEDAVKKKLGQMGFTAKEEKGYLVYRNITLPDVGSGTYNFYFKTEKKGKKDKETSLVYMLVSDKYDAFLDETREPEAITGARRFINSLNVQAEDVYIESEISKQDLVVKKAEKEWNNAVADGLSLDKKMRELEENIKKNKEQQEQKRQELEKQKQLLLDARAKRKGTI